MKKSSSDSSELFDDEFLGFKMMRLDLELMGFDKNMIQALFDLESKIEDMNHAVELLVRGPNGWTHRFVKNPFTQLCRICNCYSNEHVSEINRMQEEQDRVFARDMNSGVVRRASVLIGNTDPTQ